MVLSLPTALRDINTHSLLDDQPSMINDNALQFSIYGAEIPRVVVPEIVVPYAGQSFKVSGHTRPAYPNVVVNFTIDSKFKNYWVIYKWLDLLNNDHSSSYDDDNLSNKPQVDPAALTNGKSLIPPVEYQADITLYALDEFNEKIAKFVYTSAFPVGLGGIAFNYRTEGEIETTFEFAFSQLKMDLV